MKRLAVIIFLLLFGHLAYGQVTAFSSQAVGPSGAPVPFAKIRLCEITATGIPCTPTTPIFYDYQMTSPAPNPYSADQNGNFTFFAGAIPAPSLYLMQVSAQSGHTYNYIINGQSGVGCAITGCTFVGPIFAPSVTADMIRNAVGWLDIRSQGVVMDGATDNTTALATMITNTLGTGTGGYHFQIPRGTAVITPGPSSGPAALIFPGGGALNMLLQGRGKDYESTIQDSGANASSAPMIQLGNGLTAGIAAGLDMRDYQMRGATGESFPNGQLLLNSLNLTNISDIQVKQSSTSGGSIGIANTLAGSYPFLAEIKFTNVGVYGGNTDPTSTGIKLQSPGGNVNFMTTNVENFTTGVNFTGSNGTPVFTWTGGHMERIGSPISGNRYNAGFSFFLDQVEPHITCPDLPSGMVWLGSGVINADIHLCGSTTGWFVTYVDNGIGNAARSSSAGSNHGQGVNMTGDEWYRVANNVITDPTFLGSTAGWATTNATLSTTQVKAPGAPAGRSLYISPTIAGGYVSQTFTVTPSVDYTIGVVAALTYVAPTVEVQVYDNSSTLLWDSGSVSGPVGTPTNVNGSNNQAWNFIKKVIPSGAATSFTIRLISPGATPAQIAAVFLVPSISTFASTVPTGAASCSGSGIAFSCATAGRNNGAQNNNLTLTIASPTIQTACFLHFHAVTASDSVTPEISIGTTGSTNALGQYVYLIPNTSLDYTIPLGRCPNTIFAGDFNGPSTDPNIIVLSQVSVTPIYTQRVVPVANPNDGLFLKGIGADGLQVRGPAVPTTLLYQNPSVATLIGSGSVQTVFTTPNTIGPIIAGGGIEWRISGIRTAGAGTQNFNLAISGGANLLNCTFTSAITSGAYVFRGWLTNVAGATNTQTNTTDTMSAGASALTTCPASSLVTNYANWTSPITLVLKWQATTLNVNSAGTGCSNAAGLATTSSGAGTGMVVTITTSAGALTGATITALGTGYAVGDSVTPTQGGCTGNFIITNADHTTINELVVYQKQ